MYSGRLARRNVRRSSSVTCRPEALTETENHSGSGASHCHSASRCSDRCSTQEPISVIRPDSSAIGMNSAGEISPRSGWVQRGGTLRNLSGLRRSSSKEKVPGAAG